MSAVALPVALPPGYDAGTGEQLWVIDPVVVHPNKLTLPVASGECWLMQSVSGFLQTTGAIGTRGVTLRLRDQDGNVVFESEQTQAVFASQLCTFIFGVGMAAMSMSAGAGFTFSTISIPWVVVPAGCKYELQTDAGIPGDALQNLAHVYTKWDSGGGVGGAPGQLGPFMLVPGPGAT